MALINDCEREYVLNAGDEFKLKVMQEQLRKGLVQISKIEKTKTEGLVDTYTIILTNGNTTDFTVTNGKGLVIKAAEAECTELNDAYIDINGNLQVLIKLEPRTFNNVGTIKGPKGDQGIQGPVGPKGDPSKIKVNETTYENVEGIITLPNYYVKTEIDTKLSEKQDTISDLADIRIKANSAVQPAAISDMATKTWVEGKGYLTEHQSLTGYATENWVNNQGFIKEHQSLANYYTKSEVDTKDTTLQNNITTEANSRTSADNALQESINQEAITREQADTTLQTNINNKQDKLTSANAGNSITIVEANLPAEYQEVEYLEATGTQYIKTEYLTNANTNVEIQFLPISSGSGWQCLFGYKPTYMVTANTNNYSILFQRPNKLLGLTYRNVDTGEISGAAVSETDKNIVYNNGKSFYLNNRLVRTFTDFTTAGTSEAYLFASHDADSVRKPANYLYKGKIYYCKITENSSVVRHMIPCYRKSDSVAGMYDIITNKFYSNAGTDAFTVGPSIFPVAKISYVNNNNYQTAAQVSLAISTHNSSAEAHADIRTSINSKQDKLTAGANIIINEDGKTINSPNNPYTYIKQLADYLFEVEYSTKNIDYAYANEYFKSAPPVQNGGACTGIVKDGRVLRQLDWTYDNDVEFLVRTNAEYDEEHNISKHASIGIAAAIKDLNKSMAESGEYNKKFKMVPFIMTDGINDAGLYIQSNVVTKLAFDINPTATQECCITMAIRYMLDNCASFEDVENFFNTYHIYDTSALKYNYHFLVAKGNDWRVIELTATGHNTVSQGTDTNQMPHGIMTNFRTTDLRFTDSNLDWNSVETYGIGVERFDLATKAFTEDDVTLEALRSSLMYTNTYTNLDPDEGAWLTEFTDETAGRTVMDAANDPGKYIPIMMEEHTHYENRNRDEGANSIWQTTHSAIYDLTKKEINLVIQERQDKEFNFSLTDNEPTKQDKIKYVELTGTSGVLTDAQYNILSNDTLAYITLGGIRYNFHHVVAGRSGVIITFSSISGVLSNYIDINLGSKAWVYYSTQLATTTDLTSKLDNVDPSGTGSLSLNRAADSTVGTCSTALGYLNIASGNYQTVSGFLNAESTTAAEIIGSGNETTKAAFIAKYGSTADAGVAAATYGWGVINNNLFIPITADNWSLIADNENYTKLYQRANARVLDWNGNETIAGSFRAASLTDGTTTKTMTEVLAGGGLPLGTQASQALIWNGTEWTKQAGYGYSIVGTPTSTWDGEIDGRESTSAISEGTNLLFVKVSDQTFNISELVGKTIVSRNYDGEWADVPEVIESSQVEEVVTDLIAIKGIAAFISLKNVTYEAAPGIILTFTPGTYFSKVVAGETVSYIKSLTGISVSNLQVVKIDQKYIPTDTSKQDTLIAGSRIDIINNTINVKDDLTVNNLTAVNEIHGNTQNGNTLFNVGPVYDGTVIASDKKNAIYGKGLICLNLRSDKELKAVGENVVIVGTNCFAKEQSAFACGTNTQATASYAFSSGKDTQASRQCAFAGGRGTVADRDNEFVVGTYNKKDTDHQLFVVGNGTSDTVRSNAFVVDEFGTITATSISDGTTTKSISKLLTMEEAPDENGTYVWKCTISGGVKTYSWVKES